VIRRILRAPARASAIAIAALAAAACSSPSKHSASLKQADDLVVRVERVHVECELSRDAVSEATGWLHAIVTGDYEGDAATAYAGFMQALESSEKHAEALRGCVGPMRHAAQPFFDRWSADLNAFTNAGMRRRSQARLTEARERYDAVVAAVEPVQTGFDAYNLGMRDIGLFLSHDFNAAAGLKKDARVLTRMAEDLQRGLETTRISAQAYVQASALPIELPAESDE
jgi:hypothetical protein